MDRFAGCIPGNRLAHDRLATARPRCHGSGEYGGAVQGGHGWAVMRGLEDMAFDGRCGHAGAAGRKSALAVAAGGTGHKTVSARAIGMGLQFVGRGRFAAVGLRMMLAAGGMIVPEALIPGVVVVRTGRIRLHGVTGMIIRRTHGRRQRGQAGKRQHEYPGQ